MNTEPRSQPDPSLFARLIGRRRPPWVTVGAGLLLVLAPMGAAYLDGVLDDFLGQGYWRLSLLPTAVIIYILIVSPIMARTEVGVVEAFRPLVLMDDDEYDRLVDEASRINPIGEVIAAGVGAAFGLWVGHMWLSDPGAFWLRLTLSLSVGLMFGLLAWTIYVSVTSTRLTAELHRQDLRVDIFDTKPFEPIGRQSLIIALVFVGGIVLSMVFGLWLGSFSDWQNWLMYLILALVPILLFFLNMRDTHRVLAAEKGRELEAVQRNILRACRALMERVETNESTGPLAAEINALVAYEQRVEAARTWPYNTSMLRTLFFSVLIPGGAALARVASVMLFD